MSEIRLIAVPSGVRGTGAAANAVVRLLIVPRLDEQGLVADSIMADWPARLADLQFEVVVRTDATDPARSVDHTRLDEAKPEVWDGLFGRRVGLAVTTATPPVYPTTDVAGTTVERADRIDRGYATAAQKMAGPGGPTSPEAVAAVGETIDSFAEPAAAPSPLPPAGSGGGPPGFHAVVAQLREHPAVLRALGLIVELRIPVAELDRAGVGPAAQVRVECAGLDGLAVSPWTRYERAPGRFLPASTDAIVGGMADLTGAGLAGGSDSARWALTTVDVDGGAQRLAEAAATRTARRRRDGPDDLPALRSAGLVLLRRDRAESFDRRQRRGRENAGRDLADLELDADDLLLGYRVDIKDTGQPWRSLHQRRATYLVDGSPIRPAAVEEGHLKAFAAVTSDGGQTLHTDQVVARWAGWSLAVDPPDLTGRHARGDRRRRADVPYDLNWDFRVPDGSLPQLRFGRAYRVRLRAADAAGGGLALTDPVADAAASDLIDYARHEPIGPPHVEPPQTTLGESAVRIVIRSDPATGLDASAFSKQFPEFPPIRELSITPPETTVQVAEQHGFLDGTDRATWEIARQAIARRDDDGGLPDPAAEGVAVVLLAGPGGPTTSSADDRAWAGTWPTLEPKVLRLAESTVSGGEVATINWLEDDRTLQLLLRPAAEVTIELSSILRGGLLDHFQIRRWLEAFPASAATAGRHPMITPPLVLQLVHAVRKPLRPPSGRLTLRPPAAGATVRIFDAVLDVDTASTARLDISAAWTEWCDDPALGAPRRVPVADEAVQQIPVARGPLGPQTIRHELGDTRHRRITYTATAISRFRDCFTADRDDPVEPYVEAGKLPTVSTQSSARPPAPVVVATTPAFRWDPPEIGPDGPGAGGPPAWTSWRRTRRGDRLRVTLARPWFVSGDDERLAVLVAPSTTPDPAVQPFVSWLARDPVVRTTSPAQWPQAGVLLGHAAEGPTTLALPEAAGASVVVVPYEVFFADGHWHADVDLSTAARSSYAPFVRLALARYQPTSSGASLSTVVGSDLVNVLPDRQLVMERSGRSVTVTLSGDAAEGRVEVCVEHALGGVGSDLTRLDPAAAGPGSWTRVPGLVTTGLANVPLAPLELPAGVPLRIVVREIAATAMDVSDLSDAAELVQRTVFVEQVELPALS